MTQDLYAIAAKAGFHCKQLTLEQRQAAKRALFGDMYGVSHHTTISMCAFSSAGKTCRIKGRKYRALQRRVQRMIQAGRDILQKEGKP